MTSHELKTKLRNESAQIRKWLKEFDTYACMPDCDAKFEGLQKCLKAISACSERQKQQIQFYGYKWS